LFSSNSRHRNFIVWFFFSSSFSFPLFIKFIASKITVRAPSIAYNTILINFHLTQLSSLYGLASIMPCSILYQPPRHVETTWLRTTTDRFRSFPSRQLLYIQDVLLLLVWYFIILHVMTTESSVSHVIFLSTQNPRIDDERDRSVAFNAPFFILV
jgi:hypothetical protein